MDLLRTFQRFLNTTRIIDFLGPLALRLYLAPIFWMAGTGKLAPVHPGVRFEDLWFSAGFLG